MEIDEFHQKFQGERAFLVGNGPSLKHTPLYLLNNEHTFALNKINLIYEHTNWRPSYFLYNYHENASSIDDYMESVNLGIPCFISENGSNHFPEEKNIMYINTETVGEYSEENWSTDIYDIVYNIGNSMYVLAQVAAYMGFNELYFVGCDGYHTSFPHVIFPPQLFPKGNNPLQYDKNITSIWKFLADSESIIKSFVNGLLYKMDNNRIKNNLLGLYEYITEEDTYHFDPDYSSSGYAVNLPPYRMNYKLEKMHNMIRRIGKKRGFRTYNATINPIIDIHEHVEFVELFN